MALDALYSTLPTITTQPLNRDDQNQQRRLQEKELQTKKDFEQAQQNYSQVSNSIQAYAQGATRRVQDIQEGQTLMNEPQSPAPEIVSGQTRGALIDLLA